MAVALALPCSVVVVALDVIMCEGLETLVDAEIVVKAPVVGVVAPTVPLMLMLAVPVRLVTVPLDGVPRALPLTTKEPAVPTLTPRAVATPVPRPVMPVDTGSPVALVRVADDGVPRAGVTSVGLFDRTTEPVPVDVVTPVPPLATASVPARVSVPEVVTGPPEKVRPVVPPEALTLVTVPDPPAVEAIVIPPDVFVIVMFDPAVSVARL